MKLREIVVEDAIVAQLQAADRDEAIAELIDAVVSSGALADSERDAFVKELIRREARASTGLGKGVAVPHIKHESIETIRGALAISQKGVDFNSLDRQPVYAIFLLLSPADRPEQHLDAMKVIFDNLNQERFRRFLMQATSRDEVLTLLSEADERHLVK